MSVKLYPFQEEGIQKISEFGGRALLADDMGLGKAQPLDSPILTPSGWKRMGNLRVGDLVIGSDGRFTKILEIHPQGLRNIYRIRFRDKSWCESTGDHIWSVNSANRKRHGRPFQIMTLDQIRESGLFDGAGNAKFFIPMVEPIQFSTRKIQLDPYVLGYIIANGCLTGKHASRMTIPDEETVGRIDSGVSQLGIKVHKRSEIDYALTKENGKGGSKNPLDEILRNLKLKGKYSHQKHIPKSYLYNSVEIRIALLQGLMDGDGCTFSNHLQYGTTSKRLAKDFRFLVQSLGGTATTSVGFPSYTYKGEKRIGRKFYTIDIILPRAVQPFRLFRKLNAYRPIRKNYGPSRSITEIEFVGKKECQCIKVNASDNLYITKDCIVTHNTVQALSWVSENAISGLTVIVCPASLRYHWQREATRHFQLRSVVLEGQRPDKYDSDQLRRSHILILSYNILQAWRETLTALQPSTLIADEAHYLKSWKAKRTKAFKRLSKEVPHILALTGTPMTNRPIDLFPILNILRPDKWDSFMDFAFAHCLPGNAPVVMADLTEKPISEIKVGDYVLGWRRKEGEGQRRLVKSKVLEKWDHVAPLQKVTLENGDELICTPDHKWATGEGSGDQPQHYREAKMGRMEGKGRGTATPLMKIFRGTNPVFPESTEYRLGYIHGFFRGDGFCTRTRTVREHPFKNKRWWYSPKHTAQCACKDREPIDRIHQYLTDFDIKHKISIRPDGLHTITMNGKTSYKFLTKRSSPRNSDHWWAGFLGGIYDAEGSGRSISQSQRVNLITYKMIGKGLDRFGFTHTEYNYEEGRKPCTFYMYGDRHTLLKFWNIANPTLRRKLEHLIYSKGGKSNSGGVGSGTRPRVVKIEKLTRASMTYTLTTETGNYVAYGYGSKNCNPQKNYWGWDFSGACNIDKLHQDLTENVMVRHTKKEVMKQLPDVTRIVIPIELTRQARRDYQHAASDFASWIKDNYPKRFFRAMRAMQLVKVGYLIRLMAKLKLPATLEWIKEFLDGGDKLILFGVHKVLLQEIRNHFKKLSVYVDGGVTGIDRQRAFDQFNKNKNKRLFIGNIRAAGVGWSCSSTSATAFAEMSWIPSDHTQAEDRTRGIGRGIEGRGSVSYYLAVRDTIEEHLAGVLQEKQSTFGQVVDGANGDGRSTLDLHDLVIQKLLQEGGKVMK